MNAVKPIRLVIFDIAGTIIEDHGEVLSCFAAALKNNNIQAAEEKLHEWKGASKRDVIKHFVEAQAASSNVAELVDRIYSDFRRMLEQQYQNAGVIPIQGAETTFRWLVQRDLSIACTTGFYREVTDLILRQLGWSALFRNNVCGTDVPIGRPAPFMIFRAMETARVIDVAQVVNVGDTPLDLQAGANAGVRGIIGVLTGTAGKERLEKEQHTHIVSSVAELPSVLQADLGVE
jgi:phosphonatase-like hydrolase